MPQLQQKRVSAEEASPTGESSDSLGLDEPLSLGLVQRVERIHILCIELDDLEVVNDPLRRNRLGKNDDVAVDCPASGVVSRAITESPLRARGRLLAHLGN
jgi:hypothetical protein